MILVMLAGWPCSVAKFRLDVVVAMQQNTNNKCNKRDEEPTLNFLMIKTGQWT